MEKESFVEIVDGLVELIRISSDLDKLLNNNVKFAIPQIEEIVEALEIEFEDTERWIHWWLFDSTEDKTKVIVQRIKPYQDDLGNWIYGDVIEHTMKIPTAGDLFDMLDYKNANS